MLFSFFGGETGIRTLGTFDSTHTFQACALNRSAISPNYVLKNIEIYNYSDKKKLFKKTTNKNKSFIIKPKRNDLIILNSYIEHSVVNKNSKIVDRISLPFDLVF